MATKELEVSIDRELYACLRMNVRFLSFLEDNGLKDWEKYDQLKEQFTSEYALKMAELRNNKRPNKPKGN